MPYQVPPETPRIVKYLPPEDLRPVSTSAPVPSSTPCPPEPSSLNAAKSAELLGPSVWVAYPIKPVQTNNPSGVSAKELPSVPIATGQSEANSTGTTPVRTIQSSTAWPPSSPPSSVGNPINFVETKNSASSAINAPTAPPASTLQLSVGSRTNASATPNIGDSSPNHRQVEYNFRLKAVEPRPSTLSIVAQQQRQPVVQPILPPPSFVTPQPPSQPSGQSTPLPTERIIELTSQRQQYDTQRQIVTAEGNVVLRVSGAVVSANRLQVNVQNLVAVGEGNVVVTRGQQVLRGQRFTYNFVQDTGEILYARGDVYLPATTADFSGTLPTDVTTGGVLQQPPDQSQLANQPLQQVSSPGGINLAFGGGRYVNGINRPKRGGTVRRVRFQAERIDFYPGGWQATNTQITNDPFSPPELEVRADTATLTQLTPTQSRLVTTNPHLVFDQGFALPIPKREATIGRGQRSVNAFPIQIGYDATDKGGVFVERGFTPINTGQTRLSLVPQVLAQRAVTNPGNVASIFGLRARLDSNLGPRTLVRGLADVNGLSSNDFQNGLRASLRLRELLGNLNQPYSLSLESSYRDRLYNGTLGYQTVQSSLGAIFTSPSIALGKSGFNLSYQVGAQDVLADTDRLALLRPVRQNNRVSLGRLQGTAALNRGFLVLQGKGLPATATQGLKYTPVPVVPYLVAFGGLQGVAGYYTSGDNQSSLTASAGLQGQIGHFSRPFLDYTGFNFSYSQGLVIGASPFLFDRYVDTKVLSAGFSQQIYGPFRLGIQTALNLDTGQQISTDYILEYSRRSYGISLRYNPILRLGSINIRISDFNYIGGTNAFTGSDIQPVVNGVPRENY